MIMMIQSLIHMVFSARFDKSSRSSADAAFTQCNWVMKQCVQI